MINSDIPLKHLFLDAVSDENILKIQACITLGMDVNICDEEGVPALIHACGNLKMLELFLSQPKINVNIKYQIQGMTHVMTPLMTACGNGLTEAVQRLIQVPEIDLNFQNNKGVTAAMWAVTGGKDECVKMLRNVPGVNWNIKDKSGWSPITYAINDGNSDILRILLTIPNINPNITDFRGRTLYQIAKEKVSTHLPAVGYIECLLLLSEDSRIKLNIKRKEKERDTIKDDGVKAPECPICYERYSRNSNIFQCSQGHFVCQRCNRQISHCPKCRGKMIGRAHDFEQFLHSLKI